MFNKDENGSLFKFMVKSLGNPLSGIRNIYIILVLHVSHGYFLVQNYVPLIELALNILEESKLVHNKKPTRL